MTQVPDEAHKLSRDFKAKLVVKCSVVFLYWAGVCLPRDAYQHC